MKKKLMRLEYEKLLEETIKNVLQKKISKQMATEKIGCTSRHINRLIKNYQKLKSAAFIHKNRGSISEKKVIPEIEQQIVNLFQGKYQGFNYQHFHEYLNSDEKIDLAYSTIRLILLKNKLLSGKSHKQTKKNLIKELHKKLESDNLLQIERELTQQALVRIEDFHPAQNRKQFFGESVQMDASSHEWIKDQKWTLHGAIDDATGKILGLWFGQEETLFGYCQITKQMFLQYGSPFEIITDKRTVFWSPKEKESASETDSLTQYGFICDNLNIILKTTSVAQAKGKIERLWNTLQDRLISELRLNHITTIEEANLFLVKFINKFNENSRFVLNDQKIQSIFKPLNLEDQENIDFILGRKTARKVGNGGVIKFRNHVYAIYDNEVRMNFKTRETLLVVETLETKEIYANYYGGTWYDLVEVDQKVSYQSQQSPNKKPKKNKKVQTNLAWKNSNWLMYQKKSQKRYFGT